LSQAGKICPTCGAQNVPDAVRCTNCGVELIRTNRQSPVPQLNLRDRERFDFHYGEADLLENVLRPEATVFTFASVVILILIGIGIGYFVFQSQPSTNSAGEVLLPSPTLPPTLSAATVTLGPPTATLTMTPEPTATPTLTPTRGPCVITLPEGQSLIWAVANCGHQSLDVIPTVLALNNIADAGSVRSGQQILIPWPTETPNPEATSLPDTTSEPSARNNTGETVLVVDESIDAFAPTELPTLPAGIMWHQVAQGENIITIADLYSADVKTLSELNREMDFARCDFGFRFGGPECIVQLFQGQLMRVPAPTPTPTLSPTPDPNATATPTPTPTYNQPSVFAPDDRAFFYADQLVTLRWIPSATLNPGESYLVEVQDLTTGRSFSVLTADIVFTVPFEWRGTEQLRHEYQWTVGVVDNANTGQIRFQTDPRIFVWQGKVEGS
jgi:ribosomal protein L40E